MTEDVSDIAEQSENPAPRAIGILGNADDASAVAHHLARGGRRVLWFASADRNRQPEPVEPLIEMAATPVDVAYECHTIFSFLTDTTEILALLKGNQDHAGLVLDMSPGSVFVDFGPRIPRECQLFLGVLGMNGVGVVDATLLGTPRSGNNFTWRILAGGYPDAVQLARKSLSLLGKVEVTGPLGSAHTSVALMGYMEAAHDMAAREAETIGRELGLSAEHLTRLTRRPGKTETSVVDLMERTRLAGRMAKERGQTAEVIEFTHRKLGRNPNESD